jgi:hypothetical protein
MDPTEPPSDHDYSDQDVLDAHRDLDKFRPPTRAELARMIRLIKETPGDCHEGEIKFETLYAIADELTCVEELCKLVPDSTLEALDNDNRLLW